jgi:hypothetical protein
MTSIDERVARLERELRRTRWVSAAAVLALAACGGITQRFERAFSREYVVEGEVEGRALVRLSSDAKGGRIEVASPDGRTRTRIDANGLRLLDASGAVIWQAPPEGR